jgi:transcriptional regulator of acetoin/glycerol metabolism
MNSPFFITRQERIALARQQYFEEGILPTGVVSDAIFQSWTRCHRGHHKSQDRIEFQPVSVSRSQLALQKNRVLHEAWLSEMSALGNALGSAHCSAILTDATGVLIGATPANHMEQRIIPVAHRIGVNLSEAYVGTTAPGIVARTGKPASVWGAEHFNDAVSTMYCTAAPIRNIQGQLAGILDISSEGIPFKFDPSSVVGLYAASIENHLLIAQSSDLLIVKFQFLPVIIDTPMVGMIGFDLAGKLTWLNSVASQLLSLSAVPEERPSHTVNEIFEAEFDQLASQVGRGIHAHQLRNGLQVFTTCVLQKQGGSTDLAQHEAPSTVSTPKVLKTEIVPHSPSPAWPVNMAEGYLPASSLKQADADLIRKCLTEYKGNVSQVAKQLQVSRGLIYRRLQELGIDAALYKK